MLVTGVPGAEGLMPTLADEWIEKGKQEGLKQGLQEGLLEAWHEAIVRVAAARFTWVPADILAEVRGMRDPARLSRLVQIAATVESIRAFGQQVRQEAFQEGFQKGRQEGLREVQQDMIAQILAARFTAVPAGVLEQVRALDDLSRLIGLLRIAATVESIDGFAQALSH